MLTPRIRTVGHHATHVDDVRLWTGAIHIHRCTRRLSGKGVMLRCHVPAVVSSQAESFGCSSKLSQLTAKYRNVATVIAVWRLPIAVKEHCLTLATHQTHRRAFSFHGEACSVAAAVICVIIASNPAQALLPTSTLLQDVNVDIGQPSNYACSNVTQQGLGCAVSSKSGDPFICVQPTRPARPHLCCRVTARISTTRLFTSLPPCPIHAQHSPLCLQTSYALLPNMLMNGTEWLKPRDT